jgi:hypothetical protein
MNYIDISLFMVNIMMLSEARIIVSDGRMNKRLGKIWKQPWPISRFCSGTHLYLTKTTKNSVDIKLKSEVLPLGHLAR